MHSIDIGLLMINIRQNFYWSTLIEWMWDLLSSASARAASWLWLILITHIYFILSSKIIANQLFFKVLFKNFITPLKGHRGHSKVSPSQVKCHPLIYPFDRKCPPRYKFCAPVANNFNTLLKFHKFSFKLFYER